MASRQTTRGQAKSPGDATGKRQAHLEAEVIEEQDRQDELTTVSRQQREAELEEEIDYTGEEDRAKDRHKTKSKEEERAEAQVVDESGSSYDLNAKIEALRESDDPADRALAEDYDRMRREREANTTTQGVVEVGQSSVRIRTNADIQNMTLGVGTNYNFKAGEWARVPAHVAQHLEERDLLMH